MLWKWRKFMSSKRTIFMTMALIFFMTENGGIITAMASNLAFAFVNNVMYSNQSPFSPNHTACTPLHLYLC
ncbi:Apoptosis-stimulating of p53 protein 1 [Bienertia sinuspersici]